MNAARKKRLEKRLAILGMKKGWDCHGHTFYKGGTLQDSEAGKGQVFVFAKGQEAAKRKWQMQVKRSSVEFRLFVAFVADLLMALNNNGSCENCERYGRKPLVAFFLPLYEKALPHLNAKHRTGLMASGCSKAHDEAYTRIESMVEQWDKWAIGGACSDPQVVRLKRCPYPPLNTIGATD